MVASSSSWSRASGPAASGGPVYSFTSHSGGTQQQLLGAASGQPTCKGSQEAQGGGSGPATSCAPLYSFTSHSGGTQQRLIRAASSQPACTVAKNLLLKYKAVVGASKRLPPVKHMVEHLIETTATWPVASRYCRPGLGIRSFAHHSFAHLLIIPSLITHSLIAHSLIHSFHSNQMSDCKQFAQIAQDK